MAQRNGFRAVEIFFLGTPLVLHSVLTAHIRLNYALSTPLIRIKPEVFGVRPHKVENSEERILTMKKKTGTALTVLVTFIRCYWYWEDIHDCSLSRSVLGV